jgi:Fe-S oxidoreductase
VALVSLTANASPWFKDVVRGLVARGIPFSVPSLRAELLDEESIDLLARAGQLTLTLAPEASERLREALGKLARDEDFVRAARLAASKGMKVKLYALVGVPGETTDDLRAFAELTRRMAASGVRLELSVNPLVIKPQTPLQWLPMLPEDELNSRIRAARDLYAYERFSYYDPFEALVQGSLSLGDRDALKYIVEVARDGVGRGSWRRATSRGLLSIALRPRRSPLPGATLRGPLTRRCWRRGSGPTLSASPRPGPSWQRPRLGRTLKSPHKERSQRCGGRLAWSRTPAPQAGGPGFKSRPPHHPLKNLCPRVRPYQRF